MGKGYPMGYRHIPFFLQCMFGTGAFEDLFFFIHTRSTSSRGFSRNTKRKHMYWTLHEGSMCNPSWQFQNFIPIRQPKCLSGSKTNVQLDLIEFLLLRIEEQCLCVHYGQIEDKVWFCLLSCSSHAWKPGQNVKCWFVGFNIPIHYLSFYMVQWYYTERSHSMLFWVS